MIHHPTYFVDEFLTDHERVVLQTSPDMLAWVMGVIHEVLAIGVFVYLGASSSYELLHWLAYLFAAAITVTLVWQGLNAWYTRYVLTDYRAMRVSGVFGTDCEWMAWSKVNDVAINRTVVDWMLHTATIRIQSANESSSFAAMKDVPHPLHFADVITRLVNKRQSRIDVEDLPPLRR